MDSKSYNVLKDIKHNQGVFFYNKSKNKEQNIYEPEDVDELQALMNLCEEEALGLSLIKDDVVSMVKVQNQNNELLVDLAHVDRVIHFDQQSRLLSFQAGLQTMQLQQYIRKNNTLEPLDKSILLLNDLMMFYPKMRDGGIIPRIKPCYECLFNERIDQQVNKTAVFSFDSIAHLYELFPKIRQLKSELGHMIKDIFIINQKLMPGLNYVLRVDAHDNANQMRTYKNLKSHKWHLVVEMTANYLFFNAIYKIIHAILSHDVFYTTNEYLPQKSYFKNKAYREVPVEKISRKKPAFSLRLRIDNEINTLFNTYHQLYLLSQEYHLEPALLFHLKDNRKISIHIKCYYHKENQYQIQQVLNFIMLLNQKF